MGRLSVVLAVVFYVATLVLVLGLAYKIGQYIRTPAPFKIPATPAPVTRGGVLLRLLRELVLFESLYRASRWTWLFGWTFHAALLLVLLYHLRYLLVESRPVPAWVEDGGSYAAALLVAALLGLLGRRVAVDRVRYISAPSDYAMLLLLLAIAGSGLLLRYAMGLDILALEGFVRGWLTLSWPPLPGGWLLSLHLLSAGALLLVFPFSKLLHAPGLFWSPTRYQVDDARERRYVAPVRRRRGGDGRG